MPSLYDLVGERLALQNRLQELNFDIQTIEDTLEGDSVAINSKIESYAYVIINMESLPDAIDVEIKRLTTRKKAAVMRIDNIKNWLLINMQAAGITKIESPIFTVALQNNPPSVIIDDVAAIPEGFMRLPAPITLEPNKVMIKEAIKSGMDVAGCHLESSIKLVIK